MRNKTQLAEFSPTVVAVGEDMKIFQKTIKLCLRSIGKTLAGETLPVVFRVVFSLVLTLLFLLLARMIG